MAGYAHILHAYAYTHICSLSVCVCLTRLFVLAQLKEKEAADAQYYTRMNAQVAI